MIEQANHQLTGESTELLQTLIRSACVNDGDADSGHESRNTNVLRAYLEGPGVDVQEYAPRPGRTALVARLDGTDPAAPTICLMGHTDVVPVNPDGWSRDPFGGELIDGEIWGRGALDMLYQTATQAVAFRHLVRAGFRPRGTLIYFAVPDGWGEADERAAVAAVAATLPEGIRLEYEGRYQAMLSHE